MRLDHPNYIKLAIAAYHEKRLNNGLSPLLTQPTPAGIRKECATVYQERFDKKDEPMLRAFFGPGEQGRRFLALIQEFEVDRFRPLDSFLKEEGRRNITDRNLELLAWLIDFKHRPFVFGMEVFLTDKERQVLDMESSENIPAKEEIVSGSKQSSDNGQKFGTTLETNNDDERNTPKKEDDKSPVIVVIDTDEAAAKDGNTISKNPKWKKPAAAGLISVVLLVTIYITTRPGGNTNSGCMYWTGDHYEKVPCDTTIKDGFKLPFDESVRSLRRITREDTISERSIGKVHYIKDSGVKFYTEGGLYPEDTNRPLKKLSRYMYDKYLRKKEDSSKYASAGIK